MIELIFYYEFYHDAMVFRLRMYKRNNRFGKFYSFNIVDGRYIVKVVEITSVVVHVNPCWTWFITVNSNYVVDSFQNSGVFNPL